jgi:hypothetical protein
MGQPGLVVQFPVASSLWLERIGAQRRHYNCAAAENEIKKTFS